MEIQGYTDNSGEKGYSQKLSEERATTVKKEVLKAGIGAVRLSSEGIGEENPISDNDSEEGRIERVDRKESLKFGILGIFLEFESISSNQIFYLYT